MRKLKAFSSVYDDEDFRNICRFPNLQTLELNVFEETVTVKQNLAELNELQLPVSDISKFTWQHLLDMIGEMKKLCHIKQDHGRLEMSIDNYQNLVKLCCKQNKKVSIELHRDAFTASLQKYIKDNPCDLVKISSTSYIQ